MNRKLSKPIIQNLDKIYRMAVTVSKSFDQKAISPKVLKDCIQLGKLEKEDDNEIIHEYIEYQNAMLDELYKNCVNYMTEIEADKVSFSYLRVAIQTLKKEIFKS